VKINQHMFCMKTVKDLLGSKRGALLDIGCWRGTLEKLLPECEYTGLDIERAGDTPRNLILQDLDSKPHLPFEDGTFDIIVCTEILEHLRWPEKVAMEMRRVLKKDGVMIISLPNEFTIYGRLFHLFGRNTMAEAGHRRCFDLTEARRFMKANFAVKKEVYVPAAEFPWTGPLARALPRIFAYWLFFVVGSS